MTPTQMMILSLVVAALAALVQTATVDLNSLNLPDDNNAINEPKKAERRVTRETALPRGFQGLLNYLTSLAPLFDPKSPTFSLFKGLRSLSSGGIIPWGAPWSGKGGMGIQRVEVVTQRPRPHWRVSTTPAASSSSSSSATTCDPPCTLGSQCCLKTPGSSSASCQNMLWSGSECGWQHYTGSNPSTTVAFHNTTCPCLVGMGCVGGSNGQSGVCTFF